MALAEEMSQVSVTMGMPWAMAWRSLAVREGGPGLMLRKEVSLWFGVGDCAGGFLFWRLLRVERGM